MRLSRSLSALSVQFVSDLFSFWQFWLHPSLSVLFPSSHSSKSFTVERIPSPQYVFLHSFVQKSLLTMFPSSHSSPTRTLTLPSGHAGNVQSTSHVLVLLYVNPGSSHCSPKSTMPLPQSASSQF